MPKQNYEFLNGLDITAECLMEPEEKSSLRFAVGQNGLVAIVHYRNMERRCGSFGFYLLSNLETALAQDYFFHRHARLLGITPEALFQLILQNQPIAH